MSFVGGYQIVDLSDVTLTITDNASSAVTITSGEVANQFRSAKQIIMTGCHIVNNGVETIVDGAVYSTTRTGAHDGNNHYAILNPIRLVITTNDDQVTFTPLAILA